MDFTRIVRDVYHTFGFEDILYKVATRPEMRIGEDAVWDKAEAALIESLDACGLPYEILPGEGAFYGPKIEYHLKDCGSAVRSRWTSKCRAASEPNTLPKTTRVKCR